MIESARFWMKVAKTDDGCWNWIGAKDTKGYGHFWSGGKVKQAHRVSYERALGSIPDGLGLDHLCRNRACVRPDHLEPVTQKINTLRGQAVPALNARKTHCKRGHEFTPENTYLWPGTAHSRAARICRECRSAR